MVDTVQERALVEQARGNPHAFRALYRRYHPRMFAYVAYRVGRAEDAEDITAEVFMRAVAGLPRFVWRGDGSFSAWLFRIAHNEVQRHYAQQRRAPLTLDDLPEISDGGLNTPDHVLQRKEQFAQLYTAISALSPRRREIITLRFFAELRNKEIADVLGLDERTVAAHLCRALEDLQRHLAPYHDSQLEEPRG